MSGPLPILLAGMLIPGADVSNKVTTMSLVRSPSTASVAVAPGSVNTAPTSSSILASPNKVITGATVSTATAATTLTERVTGVAALPAASETL